VPDGGEQHDDRPTSTGGGRRVGHRPPAPGDIVVGPESRSCPSPWSGAPSRRRSRTTSPRHHPAVATVGDEGPAPHPVAPPPPPRAPRPIRAVLGEADGTVYVIDDGRHHVSVGRRIGSSAECEYCLIGRLPIERYEQLAAGRSRARRVRRRRRADGLRRGRRGGVASSNVFDVARYDAPATSRAPTGRARPTCS